LAEAATTEDKPKVPEMGVILRGVKVVDLKPKIRNSLSVPAQIEGVMVESVDPDSPAHRAGLQSGDLILEINREPVKNAANTQRLAKAAKGKMILLFIWRKGSSSFLAVKRHL
jgi:serine protease Do